MDWFVSRPRRFGKSYAAQMLCAYYDHTCSSYAMFENLSISKAESYTEHLNRYNVIYLDIAGFVSDLKRRNEDLRSIPDEILAAVKRELVADFSDLKDTDRMTECLIAYVQKTGKKFVFIIDEWDAVIREAGNHEDVQNAYLNLLREWFKNGNFTSRVVAAVYMTGILPIKKDKSQSAISDFDEYSVLEPGDFSIYTGFTEEEVKQLCEY